MNSIKKNAAGIAVTVVLALLAGSLSKTIPHGLISGGVFALLIGMALNPFAMRYAFLKPGIGIASKQVLRLAIVLMGLTLSFSQVLLVGKYSLIVMCFTLFAAFGGGYLLGRLLGMGWRLSGLISAGTGVCGGSAIAAIAPVIDARDRDIAYAISATFIFDILMVVLFPIAGRHFGMSDMGFGLWTGTAVNDTSSVVAAGYAYSDAAGAYALIVKLTRTLSIVPIVLVFSLIQARSECKTADGGAKRSCPDIRKIFPYFILLFLLMIMVRSTGFVSDDTGKTVSSLSKFLMVMALGAIGLKTNFRELADAGFAPLFHGFAISTLVVVVAFAVQASLGQM